MRAEIEDQYESGIFSRLRGWTDAQGLEHDLAPTLGKCTKVFGKELVIKSQFD